MTEVSMSDLRAALADGKPIDGRVLSINCSRCGRPYAEHCHTEAEARDVENTNNGRLNYVNRHGMIRHAFRTQTEVGRLVWPRGDGPVYPDGRWDETRRYES